MRSKIIFILLLALAACDKSDTPRSVAGKFLDAMSKQDYETAKKYGTEETMKLLDMMSGFSKMSKDTIKDSKFEISRESVEGEKAVIYYKEDNRDAELQLPMVKIEGKWKVLLSKESINSSDGLKSMDMGATSLDTTK